MRIRAIDLAVILVYLTGITLFGLRFRRSQQNLRDYFLGGARRRGGRLQLPSSPPKRQRSQ
jgi:Na+/proline symporter